MGTCFHDPRRPVRRRPEVAVGNTGRKPPGQMKRPSSIARGDCFLVDIEELGVDLEVVLAGVGGRPCGRARGSCRSRAPGTGRAGRIAEFGWSKLCHRPRLDELGVRHEVAGVLDLPGRHPGLLQALLGRLGVETDATQPPTSSSTSSDRSRRAASSARPGSASMPLASPTSRAQSPSSRHETASHSPSAAAVALVRDELAEGVTVADRVGLAAVVQEVDAAPDRSGSRPSPSGRCRRAAPPRCGRGARSAARTAKAGATGRPRCRCSEKPGPEIAATGRVGEVGQAAQGVDGRGIGDEV